MRPKKNVTFAAPPPPAQIYVRKRDAFAVFCVAVIAAVAGHYFGTLANAPPDVAAIAEQVRPGGAALRDDGRLVGRRARESAARDERAPRVLE